MYLGGSGESEEAAGISGIEKEGQIYGQRSVVRVRLTSEHQGDSARLYRLELREESGRVIELELGADGLKVTVDGEETALTDGILEIDGNTYELSQTGTHLELEYITYGEMSLEIEYILEKEISA